jgi:class 3 adenylate cyclase
MDVIAARSGIKHGDLVMRSGLYCSSTFHIGNITTSARIEVTALGKEVNEAARIVACASGGLTLASKASVEWLDGHTAQVPGSILTV